MRRGNRTPEKGEYVGKINQDIQLSQKALAAAAGAGASIQIVNIGQVVVKASAGERPIKADPEPIDPSSLTCVLAGLLAAVPPPRLRNAVRLLEAAALDHYDGRQERAAEFLGVTSRAIRNDRAGIAEARRLLEP